MIHSLLITALLLKTLQLFPREIRREFYKSLSGTAEKDDPREKKKSFVTDLDIGVGSSPWSPPSVPGIRLPRRRVHCTPSSAVGCRWSRRQSRSSSSTTHSSCRPLSGPKRENKTECENRSHWKEACAFAYKGRTQGRANWSPKVLEGKDHQKKSSDNSGNGNLLGSSATSDGYVMAQQDASAVTFQIFCPYITP